MDAKHLLVEDVMSVDPVVVKVDASLGEADLVLRTTYTRGIPVVDRNGVLVGVLSHAHLAEYRFADGGPLGRANQIRSESTGWRAAMTTAEPIGPPSAERPVAARRAAGAT